MIKYGKFVGTQNTELEDMWGRVVQKIGLPSYARTVNTQLSHIVIPGVYTYKYIVNGHSKEAGKLIISK